MGIFTGDEEEEFVPVPVPNNKPAQIVEQKPIDKLAPAQGNYDSVILDSKYHNLRTFISQMDGTTVTIQFYHNLLGAVDMPEITDLTGDTFNSQYRYIRNLQVKMQGDKSFSKNPEDGIVSIGGNFNTYPGFTPSKYDVFTMDAGEGRKYLCYLEEANELADRRDRACACTYKVIEVVTPEIQAGLDKRVIETFVFDKSLLSTTPYIKESLLVVLDNLRKTRTNLISYYFNTFFNSTVKGLFYRRGTAYGLENVYDEITSSVFRAVIPDYSGFSGREINTFNCGYSLHHPNTIWTMLLEANDSKRGIIRTTAKTLSCNELPIDFENLNIRLTPINYFHFVNGVQNVYLDVRLFADDPKPVPITDASESVPEGSIGYMAAKYKSHNENGFYVLSGAFYAGDREAMSDLELLVSDYLAGQLLDPEETLRVVEETLTKRINADLYFYIPVMMILINSILR